MTRFREFGLSSGALETGQSNSMLDVAGVRVGHATLIEGEHIRTGVTAILPHERNLFKEKVPAAVYTINGYGKAVGFEQVRELGSIETPIMLTNTLNVGKVADALIGYMLDSDPDIGTVNPLVGECNDGYLSDIHGRHVAAAHVLEAIENARNSDTIIEGCVGAGTGTSCYQFKGGIGTASRVVPDGYHVGALVQTNFGARPELNILGVPIGQHLPGIEDEPGKDGSVMMVIATDAPLTARQLGRLARRASFGIARTGTVCHHGSGDFVIAFSTAYTLPDTDSKMVSCLPDNNAVFNPLFQAVVESIEESVYNALLAAETMTGHDGKTLYALPHDKLTHWLRYYRRMPE